MKRRAELTVAELLVKSYLLAGYFRASVAAIGSGKPAFAPYYISLPPAFNLPLHVRTRKLGTCDHLGTLGRECVVLHYQVLQFLPAYSILNSVGNVCPQHFAGSFGD